MVQVKHLQKTVRGKTTNLKNHIPIVQIHLRDENHRLREETPQETKAIQKMVAR